MGWDPTTKSIYDDKARVAVPKDKSDMNVQSGGGAAIAATGDNPTAPTQISSTKTLKSR